MTATSAPNPWIEALRRGWRAGVRNRVPAFILWCIGMALLGGYYSWPPLRESLNEIARLKQSGGLLVAACTTGFAGGVLPTLFQLFASPVVRAKALRDAPFQTAFWFCKGIEIDLFYRGQALIFGESPTLPIVAVKVFVDQFIYCTFWAVPTMVFLYQWKENSYSLLQTWAGIDRRWVRENALPVLVTNWVIWTPTVFIIYSLPLGLQLPIQNIVLSLFVLLLVVLTKRGEDPETAPRQG